jgi:uncharacterized protein involved in type VI secretion and phage assembly
MYSNVNEKLINNISERNADKIPALTFGKVIQNYDEKHPKKVKVKLRNSMGVENNEIWADVIFSYAGDEYGNYVMPEIDSEVIVAFVMNSRSFPVVIGNIYPPDKNLPPETADKDNYIKTFKTKAGNKIIVNDNKDNTCISVNTIKGLSMSFDEKANTILISDKDGTGKIEMNFEKKSISIDSKENISFKISDKEIIKISSDSVEINTKEFKLKAGNKVNLSGGQATVEGTEVNIKSNGNVGIKATGNLSMEATGMAKVKGSMLNLN